MAIHYTQLFFNYPINVSVQRGDMVYYVNTSVNNPPQTGTVFEIGGSAIREIGEVYDIFDCVACGGITSGGSGTIHNCHACRDFLAA